jgi:hypothetical protein
MTNFTLIDLPTFKDPRGSLTVFDNLLPFVPTRLYWIYESDGHARGGHRHRETRQALIAIMGSVDIFMDDGIKSETVVLSSPRKCLLVEPKDWHTMTFGAGSILLVLASHPYDQSDYIDTKYPEPVCD